MKPAPPVTRSRSMATILWGVAGAPGTECEARGLVERVDGPRRGPFAGRVPALGQGLDAEALRELHRGAQGLGSHHALRVDVQAIGQPVILADGGGGDVVLEAQDVAL